MHTALRKFPNNKYCIMNQAVRNGQPDFLFAGIDKAKTLCYNTFNI